MGHYFEVTLINNYLILISNSNTCSLLVIFTSELGKIILNFIGKCTASC